MDTISTDNPSKTIRDSFKLASSGIEGPVLIDFPSDLGLSDVEETIYNLSESNINKLDFDSINKIKALLNNSKKPLVIVGDGVRKDNSINELISFIDNLNAAVLSSMKAREYIKKIENWLGVITDYNENLNTHTGSVISKADLIINIGVDQMMTHSPWPKGKRRL